MRFLRMEKDGNVTPVEIHGELPPYAILSHTWGHDNDEVSFKDMAKGRAKNKVGYRKIEFCVEQALYDGLDYFWIDTCCIDKSSSAELSEAILSMFKYYRNAVKCYVYLSDFSTKARSQMMAKQVELSDEDIRNRILKQSRCRLPQINNHNLYDIQLTSIGFTRGWTLQELLAPKEVEFFSVEGVYLGDKRTLMEEIHEITHINKKALTGASLDSFSVEERLGWGENRNTKREEDSVYSLWGLFDVQMAVLYGEGRKKAMNRLLRAIASEVDSGIPARSEEIAKSSPSGGGVDSRRHPPTQVTDETHAADSTHKSLVLNDRKASVPGKTEGPPVNAAQIHEWWNGYIGRNIRSDRYNKVAVLLIRWAARVDSVQNLDHAEELEKVFRHRFHFHTKIIDIYDSVRHRAQHQISDSLGEFIAENDGPRNLLIIFYAGYGEYHYHPMGWKMKNIANEAHFSWNEVQKILLSDSVESDLLQILDITSPPSSMPSNPSTEQERTANTSSDQMSRRVELLSSFSPQAVDWSSSLEFMGWRGSFTWMLTDSLLEMSNEDVISFSTFQLSQRMNTHERRYNKIIQLVRQSGDLKSHIRIQPTVARAATADTPVRRRPVGHVDLRFSLGDMPLTRRQIEFMARTLTDTFNRQSVVSVNSIEWLGMESEG